MSEPVDEKYCIRCARKSPAVETLLVVGENINKRRWDKSQYWCDNCYRDYQTKHRRGELYDDQQSRDEKRQQKVDELSQYWEDPILVQQFEDHPRRLVELMRKYNIRTPEAGYTWDVIGEVVYNNLWYFDVDEDIQEYLKAKGLRGYLKHNIKGHISAYVGTLSEVIRNGQHVAVSTKVKALETSANNHYKGQEKIVATPAYEDENGNQENRHFLESDFVVHGIRTSRKQGLKQQIDNSIEEEYKIVEKIQTAKEVISDEGGETQ